MGSLKRKIEAKTYIEWRIEKFSVVSLQTNSYGAMKSDVFQLVENSSASFQLCFEPTSTQILEHKQYVSLYLSLVASEPNGSPIRLRFKFWLQNEDGKRIGERTTSHEFLLHLLNDWAGFSDFLHHSEIYAPQSQFLINDVVIICCQIENEDNLPPITHEGQSSHDLSFRSFLWDLRDHDLSGSCTIHVGKKEFKIAKLVLAAQSKYFRTMFLAGTDGSDIIEAPFTNEKAMQSFIKYMYFGEVNDLDSIVEDLYIIADEYKVATLKHMCYTHIITTLNDSNVFARLYLAFLRNNVKLKQLTMDHVMDLKNGCNYQGLLVSKDWFQWALDHLELAAEITKAIFGCFKS